MECDYLNCYNAKVVGTELSYTYSAQRFILPLIVYRRYGRTEICPQKGVMAIGHTVVQHASLDEASSRLEEFWVGVSSFNIECCVTVPFVQTKDNVTLLLSFS